MPDTVSRAIAVLRPGEWREAADSVALDYAARFLRRRRLTAASGREILADLPETVSLNDGDGLRLDDGSVVAVRAAPEELVEVRGADLARLAWHVGNRHTPCEIGERRLVIRRDHVIEAMLDQLGAVLKPVSAPFRPEGGAYGFGRTLGHAHRAGEGDPDHEAPHGPAHGHLRVHTHISHGQPKGDGDDADGEV
ncbi:MAG: urease accessory protein UreE [Paracoccaceae bacterium]